MDFYLINPKDLPPGTKYKVLSSRGDLFQDRFVIQCDIKLNAPTWIPPKEWLEGWVPLEETAPMPVDLTAGIPDEAILKAVTKRGLKISG